MYQYWFVTTCFRPGWPGVLDKPAVVDQLVTNPYTHRRFYIDRIERDVVWVIEGDQKAYNDHLDSEGVWEREDDGKPLL